VAAALLQLTFASDAESDPEKVFGNLLISTVQISTPLLSQSISLDSLKLVGIFAWHVLAGCVLFVTVCFGAIGLDVFTGWMNSIGMPIYITYAGSLLEYFVFTVDVVCFVVFVLKEAVLLIRQILQR
jgi:hypothetical protein